MKKKNNILKKIADKAYEFGFVSKIKTDIIESGLNEDTIRLISSKKNEPEWMLEFRLTAYRHWLTMEMPQWAHLDIPPIDYQAISYYADPLKKSKDNKVEGYEFEINNPFDRGEIQGGFAYIQFSDPEKNKLIMMSKKIWENLILNIK